MEPPLKIKDRVIILIYLCLLGFGTYFCYANPLVLFDLFGKEAQTEHLKFLFLIHTIPNVLFSLVGGIMMDRWIGLKRGLMASTFMMLIGQLIFVCACFLGAFKLALFGRFLYGIGAETLFVAQKTCTAIWLKCSKLNLIFGFLFTTQYLGGTMIFLGRVMGGAMHFTQVALGGFLLFSCVMCIIVALSAIILGMIDKKIQLTVSCLDQVSEEETLKDFSTMKGYFGIVSFISAAFCFAIFPFIIMELSYMMDENSDLLVFMGSVFLLAFLAAPWFGFLIDISGCNMAWIFGASIITVLSHIFIGFTSLFPYVFLVIMGLSYSILAAVIWPMVTNIVPGKHLGTAYGLCHSVQNLSITLFIYTTDKFGVTDWDHVWVHYSFMGLLCVSIIAISIFWICEACSEGPSNSALTNVIPNVFHSRRQSIQVQVLVN